MKNEYLPVTKAKVANAKYLHCTSFQNNCSLIHFSLTQGQPHERTRAGLNLRLLREKREFNWSHSHIYICIYMCIHVHMCKHIYMYIDLYIYIYMYIYVYIYIYIQGHIYKYICIYTYTYIYIYMYIYV